MERLKNTNTFQRVILIIMPVMLIAFAIIYAKAISQEGLLYNKSILIPTEENGITTYSGKVDGKKAYFTVTSDNTVEYHFGDKVYGPYTVVQDPSAVPDDFDSSISLKGVELRCGDEVIFRGGILNEPDMFTIFSEAEEGGEFVISDGIWYDSDGTEIDGDAPSNYSILSLMYNPVMEHRGDWMMFPVAILICALNVVSILYADELFRFSMRFRVANADTVEPAEWEIISRYIAWVMLTILVAIYLCMGLSL